MANLDKQSILDAIDYEIERINAQKKFRGWNVWLIYVGGATLVNIGLDVLKNPQISVFKVILLFLSLKVLQRIFHFFFRLIKYWGSSKNEKNVYFRFVDQDLPESVCELLFFGAALFLLFDGKLNGFVQREYLTILMVVSILMVGSYILYFLIYVSKLHIPIKFELISTAQSIPSPVKKYQACVLTINLLLYFFIFSKLLQMVWGVLPGLEPDELKLTLIFVGLSVLLDIYLGNMGDESLLESLSKIRRGLSLGLIEPGVAAGQVEVILLGMKSVDIFHAEINKIVGIYEKMNDGMCEMLKLYYDYQKNPQKDEPSELEKYKKTILEWGGKFKAFDKDLKETATKLGRKIEIYKLFSGDFQNNELTERIKEAETKTQEQVKILQKEIVDPKFKSIAGGGSEPKQT